MLIFQVFICYFSISAPREISVIFYAEYTQKEKSPAGPVAAQRGDALWLPRGPFFPTPDKGKDMSFSSIFSYNNK
jgi:hypothetical protein